MVALYRPLDATPMEAVAAIYTRTRGGLQLIEAEVVGPFALHRPIGVAWNQEGSYTLTHVGSGLQVATLSSLDAGRELAAKLQAMRVNWAFRDENTTKSWPEHQRRRLRAIVDDATDEATAS